MVTQCMCFTRVFATVKTAFAFSLVLDHNACVSNACLHRLKRLLVFLSIALQCMHFTRVFASVKTAFEFSLVWRQSKCVSHASYHRFIRFFPFSLFLRHMHAFQMRVCIS